MSRDDQGHAGAFLSALTDQVADRFARFAQTSALATSEAASTAGRDLGTWLLRQVRGQGGDGAIALAQELPRRPQAETAEAGSWFVQANFLGAATVVWTSVVVTPVLARRVFLEDVRRALDESSTQYAALNQEAVELLSAHRRRLESSLARDGVDTAVALPAALESVTIEMNWIRNDLTLLEFERDIRFVVDTDGYDWTLHEAEAAAREGLTWAARLADIQVSDHQANEEEVPDHDERLRIVAQRLGMSKGRSARRVNPADSFASATAAAFRASVREARRIRA